MDAGSTTGRHHQRVSVPSVRPVENVYSYLHRGILLGEFSPGQQLKEIPLSKTLSTSRSPIRAAFRRLLDEGLVVAQPNRGVFVVPWADRDDDEVFDLRATLESHAAGLAAARRDANQVRQLKSINDLTAMLIETRPDDFLSRVQATNREFHDCVLQAAASPRLLSIVQRLLSVQRPTGAFFYYSDKQLDDSLTDHRQIARAIERGEIEVARSAVEAHIRGTGERLKALRQPAQSTTIDSVAPVAGLQLGELAR